MRISYNDLDIKFSIEYINFYMLHIACERFLRSIPSHSHSDNSYEIHYIPYGQGKVKIDQVVYPVIPNTLYVTGPHIEHEQIPDKDDPMIEYCIYLKLEKKNHDKGKEKQGSYLQLFENTKSWFGQDIQNIHPLMQQIFLELENKYSGYIKQVETLLQQLVILMIRNYENNRQSQNQAKSFDLAYSKYIIIEEYFLYEYKDLSLVVLASRLGLSTRQTERLLNQHYDKTFLQKKSEAKMSAASILLLDQKKRITDIALELGYSSVEHFSNAFKRYYHKTAREYRKNINSNTL
ncbi:MAG TPA: AraC family transcriptional regulator [Mobilitalea sp.]|nr:AraC family transcriptional regulator [Mobilitalea sp.]